MKITKKDLKRAMKCPAGMHMGQLCTVDKSYLKANGCEVFPVEFETEAGYIVKCWFNSAVKDNAIEFIQSADDVTFNMDNFEELDLDEKMLKSYLGKPVAFNVEHQKDDGGVVRANITNFYSASTVPF
jgi:hypothetical protein